MGHKIFCSYFAVVMPALLLLNGCQTQKYIYESPAADHNSGVSDWGATADDQNAVLGNNADLIPVKQELNLPVIYFGYNADMLDQIEQQKLDRVCAFLQKNQQLYLIISGHCDQRGTGEYNRALGDRRANVILHYLTGHGIAAERLRTVSYGKDRPAVKGTDEESLARNRRGELTAALKRK